MARSINRLSARTVDSITTPGRHSDGGNLFLIVDKPRAGSGKPSKRWAFIYRWDGRLREMGLGSVTAINLARARESAAQCRVFLAVSQRIRKRIEEAFGWGKTVGTAAKTMLRGTQRVGFQFTLNMAAYNLARLPKLLAA